MTRHVRYLLMCAGLLALTLHVGRGASAEQPNKPRLLVLPWVVIDRTTNKVCPTSASVTSRSNREETALAHSAEAALDAEMHRFGRAQMIPRDEWEPEWRQRKADQVVRQGEGCAVCTPVGQLLQYDRTALQELAQAVRADYVWIGVTVVPLTRDTKDTRTDACCREALALEREAVLVRSSALLVRVNDGETIWERDARRLEREVPTRFPGERSGKFLARHSINHTPAKHREIAVMTTAHDLGQAFRRVHADGLR